MKKEAPRSPSKLIYFLGRRLVLPFYNIKYNVHFRKEKLEGPFILLSNHNAYFDPFLTGSFLYPIRLNFVGGYRYSKDKLLSPLARLLGTIPKFQYDYDLSVIKDMLEVLKNKQNLALFPSGRLSTYGEEELITKSIAKFIKKAKVNVYIQNIEGSYFSKPKWSRTTRRGRIDVKIVRRITKEEIDKLNIEEINEIIQENLRYNEFKTQKEKKIYFKGRKLAEGLENVLFMCPRCKRLHTIETLDNEVYCTACNFKTTLNNYYEFNDNKIKNIYDWSKLLKEKISEIVSKDFEFKDYTDIKIFEKGKDKLIGKGEVILNKEGITFNGVFKNEKTMFKIPKSALISLPFKSGTNFEVMYKKQILKFYLDNPRQIALWTLIIEELYKNK